MHLSLQPHSSMPLWYNYKSRECQDPYIEIQRWAQQKVPCQQSRCNKYRPQSKRRLGSCPHSGHRLSFFLTDGSLPLSFSFHFKVIFCLSLGKSQNYCIPREAFSFCFGAVCFFSSSFWHKNRQYSTPVCVSLSPCLVDDLSNKCQMHLFS